MNQRDLINQVTNLKKEKQAVILAHNYQLPEVQDIADFVGDSLELSRRAASLDAEVIVFCGVHFMAETAAILSPGKKVLLPDREAGCPMADMITARELILWKEQFPGRKIVCYVNTTAEVKAESDICCTSSNAVKVVQALGEDEILFIPDKNLADYVKRITGKKIVAWDGYCYVHHRFKPEDIIEKKNLYPEAEVWVHPECQPAVIDLADKVLSTGQMAAESRLTRARQVIIVTEKGIIHRLNKENPDVFFCPAREDAACFNMKKITLEKILRALETDDYQVQVPEEQASKARRAIEAMLDVI